MSIMSEIREKSDEAQNKRANFIKSLDQSQVICLLAILPGSVP